MPSQTVALPDIKTWELRDKSGQVRTFEQTELSIEGEVRIVQLAGQTIDRLNKAGFPWDEVAAIFAEEGQIDWARASDILMLVIAEVPEFVAESTCILFGLYPVDENGVRNKDYDADKKFIRQSLNFTRWVEILEVFTEQNDYKRLARPFSMAVTRAMEAGYLLQAQQMMRQNPSDSSSPESTDSSPQDTADQKQS
jgi:hypothetical protein